MDTAPLGPSCFFKLIRADARQMLVSSGSIVEALDVVGDVIGRLLARVVNALLDALFFRLEKKDSATALSQQLPRRLMLGVRPFVLQNRSQSSLPYWTDSTGRRNTGLSGRF